MLALGALGAVVVSASAILAADATGSVAAVASALAVVLGSVALLQSNRSKSKADRASQTLAEKTSATDAFEARINLSQESMMAALAQADKRQAYSDAENKQLRTENVALKSRVDELEESGRQTAEDCRDCKRNLAVVQAKLDRLEGTAS